MEHGKISRSRVVGQEPTDTWVAGSKAGKQRLLHGTPRRKATGNSEERRIRGYRPLVTPRPPGMSAQIAQAVAKTARGHASGSFIPHHPVDDISRRLSQKQAATILAAFDAHVAQAFLGIERRVSIQDEPVMGRMAWVSPGKQQRIGF